MIINLRYLLDNNALANIPIDARRGAFVRQNCRLPDEVLYEAQGYPDIAELADLAYPTTVAVLRALIKVMASLPPSDSKLVDLYHNRGNADPLLVACALVERELNEQRLLTEKWVIVSDDRAVQAKAAEFEVDFLSSEQFLVVVGSSGTAP